MKSHRECLGTQSWRFIILILLMAYSFCITILYNVSNENKNSPLLQNVTVTNSSRKKYKCVLINRREFAMRESEAQAYPKGTPLCKLNLSSFGPITVNKTALSNNWVEKVHSGVKLGGFYAPAYCRSTFRIAVFIPYRNRQDNLVIFLYYIHRLLKKQLSEYRIFIVEQFGTDKFNRGLLFNVAFLESQRFGSWNCLIFHDVDLIPEDDRIVYTCSRSPFHLASAIDRYGYNLRYEEEFGGVTALTPTQFEAVNGYSNFYWSWGGEDDDMSARLKFKNLNISRYDASISRFATLPHQHATKASTRLLFLLLCRERFQKEGLRTTNYKLISVEKRKLFTHILVDVNPLKLKIDEKNLFHQMSEISGSDIYGCRKTFLIHKVPKPTVPYKLEK